MAVEDDILKTLGRIEKILGQGSVASGLGRAPPRVAGGRNGSTDPAADRSNSRDTGNQKKTFKAVVVSLNNLNDSSNNLNRSFSGLSKTVLNTRANFIEMNRSMRALTRAQPQTIQNQPAPVVDVDLSGINGVILQIQNLLRPRPGAPRPVPPGSPGRPTPGPSPRPQPLPPGGPTPGPGGGGGGGRGPGGLLGGLFDGPGSPGGRLAGGLRNLFADTNVVAGGFIVAAKLLAGAIAPVVEDILKLEAAGISSSSALGGLYLDAAMAGMSLSEYTKVLQDSSPAVSRALSMDAFNKTLQVSRDRLENLGIFGAEATKLSASLANSATTLGVPQANLADATNAQIATFATLRKTSLLTAEGFQQLTAELANSQEVQSNLLGLQGDERAARFDELTQIRTLGLRMGATQQASDALGKALLAQRDLTAPKRFESAGRIRQAGAMFGMDPGDTDTLAGLSRKKNLTVDEAATATALGADLQSRIEAELNSGDIQRENNAEVMQESLNSSGIGKFLQAAGNANLTSQSGPAGVNKDFANGTSGLLKAVGRWAAVLDGAEQNPIAKAVAGALGAIFGGFGLRSLFRALPRLIPSLGGGPRLGPIPPGGGPPAPIEGGLRGMFNSVIESMKNAGGKILDAGKTLVTAIKGAFGWVGDMLGGAGGTIWESIKSFGGLLKDGAGWVVDVLKGSAGTVWEGIKDLGAGVRGAFGSLFSGAGAELGPALLTASKTILGGAFKLLGGTGVFSSVIGGIMEAVTGDLGSALNADNGKTWFGSGLLGFVDKTMDKIGDIIGGMIRGFATGITDLGDLGITLWNNTIGKLFDSMSIDLGGTLTNFFDRTWTAVMITFKEAKLAFAKFFGMDDSAKEIQADIDVAKSSQDKLEADGKATLTSIGDANQKAADQQKTIAATTVKTVNQSTQAMTGTKDITASILGTAQAISDRADAGTAAATAVTDAVAAAPIATPVTPPSPTVTPPAVNSPDNTATPPSPTPATPATGVDGTVSTDPVVIQLIAMTKILTDMLTAEQLQAAGLSSLASAAGRPVFADNEQKFQLLNQSNG